VLRNLDLVGRIEHAPILKEDHGTLHHAVLDIDHDGD